MELKMLYNYNVDYVFHAPKAHVRRYQWIPDLELVQRDDPSEPEEVLLSFSPTPVKPCSLPLGGK